MEYKYENDRTIRITLTFADLEARDIVLMDFMNSEELMEELFSEIATELDLDERWSDPATTSVEVRPHSAGIDLLVTDDLNGMDDVTYSDISKHFEEFLQQISGDTTFKIDPQIAENLEFQLADKQIVNETVSKRTKKESKDKQPTERTPEPDYIAYTICFKEFSDVLRLAKTVSAKVEESELYLFKEDYYLTVIDNEKEKGKEEVMTLRALMLEYGEQGMLNRDLLREHGKTLIDHDAFDTLEKL